MTSLTVEEGNKLISLFMDNNHTKQLLKDMAYDKTQGESFNLNETATLETFKYHTSWNWLMPVYEKIACKWQTLSNKKVGEIKDIKEALQNRLVLAEINGVWEFSVAFIQWFNNNQNNTK